MLLYTCRLNRCLIGLFSHVTASDSSLALDFFVHYQVFVCMYVCTACLAWYRITEPVGRARI